MCMRNLQHKSEWKKKIIKKYSENKDVIRRKRMSRQTEIVNYFEESKSLMLLWHKWTNTYLIAAHWWVIFHAMPIKKINIVRCWKSQTYFRITTKCILLLEYETSSLHHCFVAVGFSVAHFFPTSFSYAWPLLSRSLKCLTSVISSV